MAEKSERGQGGTKCRKCPYWCKKCKEINLTRPAQTHQECETLCWCCKHAVPDKSGKIGCEWSMYHQPVPGWTVSASEDYIISAGKKLKSYRVAKCPKFERG